MIILNWKIEKKLKDKGIEMPLVPNNIAKKKK